MSLAPFCRHKTLLPTTSDPSPLQPMSDIHDALPSPPNSDSHSPPVESCIDPSNTGIMDEEYTGHLHKRSKDDGVGDDEDEGVSLPEIKKFKEDLPLPIDYSRLRLGGSIIYVYTYVHVHDCVY